jgi:flagellar hook-basal body complex protein FliE
MRVEPGRTLGSVDPQQIYQAQIQPPDQTSFAQTLQSALDEINSLQTRRDDMVTNMIAGNVTEVHDVMAAAEEAQLAFELLLETRNRLLESYQEIMRLQV